MRTILFVVLITLSAHLQLNAQCHAAYTVAPDASQNLKMVFTNTSTIGSYPNNPGAYTTALLNFGDGVTTPYLFNVPGNVLPHTYPAPGNYTTGYRLRVIDTTTGAVLCTDTATVHIAVTGTTAVISVAGNAPYSISVKPLPARGSLSIELSGDYARATDGLLTLYSISGQRVGEWVVGSTQQSLKLDVSSLPAGMYFLKGSGSLADVACRIPVE